MTTHLTRSKDAEIMYLKKYQEECLLWQNKYRQAKKRIRALNKEIARLESENEKYGRAYREQEKAFEHQWNGTPKQASEKELDKFLEGFLPTP